MMRYHRSKKPPVVSFRSLCDESDKGCVIILASVLDETLRQLHQFHIEATTYPTKKKIFQSLDSVHAPLSSFAGRIQIAFAYGLIDEEEFNELQLIRHLRNHAAHTLYDFKLSDNGARNIIHSLQAAARYHKAIPEGTGNQKPAVRGLTLPSISEEKRRLLLNGLALHDSLQGKLIAALEVVLKKRRS